MCCRIAFVYIMSPLRCSFFSSPLRQRRARFSVFRRNSESAKGEGKIVLELSPERGDDSAVQSRRLRPLSRRFHSKPISCHRSLSQSCQVGSSFFHVIFPLSDNVSASANCDVILQEIVANCSSKPMSGLRCRSRNSC